MRDENIGKQKLYESFVPITTESERLFMPYRGSDIFGDTTFSLLYSWGSSFNYGVRRLKDALLVTEESIDGRLVCILKKNKNTDMTAAAAEALSIFENAGLPLYFGYVDAAELEIYARAAAELGREISAETVRGDSDYIYRTEEFISVDGRKNKKLRTDLNSLMRHYPDITMRMYDGSDGVFRRDCLRVFDSWCSGRECGKCVYGCEKTAFERFFDIFDPARHSIGASYSDGKMLSFAASEIINSDTVCYYFQKNASRIRGLTFWLNREMAKRQPGFGYINLGEDMGLEGLTIDKMSLHPCEVRDKYTVKFEKR